MNYKNKALFILILYTISLDITASTQEESSSISTPEEPSPYTQEEPEQSNQEVLDEPVVYVISIGPVNQNPNSKKPDNSFKTWTVYKLDANIPLPNGMALTTEEHVLRSIWMKIADERNISAMMGSDNNYADDYLKQMESQRGVTSTAIKQMCEKNGFTFDDLKKEINIQHLIQQAIEVTLTAKGMLLITPEEIEDYAEEHPAKIDTKYTLLKGDKKVNSKDYTWYDPYTVEEKKLAKKFAHVVDLKAGDTVCTNFDEENKTETVYKLQKVEPGYTVSISKRRDEITRILQNQKYKAGYKSVLLDALDDTELIIFTNKSYRDHMREHIKNAL